MADVKQISERNNNNSESFISDRSEYPDIEAKTTQTKKKRKEKKKNQDLIFQKAMNADVSMIQKMYHIRAVKVIKGSIMINFMKKWMA